MNYASRLRDPKTVEIFPELFHFIPARNAVDLQIGRRGFRVVGLQLEPDIRVAQIRDSIEPKPVRAELENAAFVFLFNQREPKRVAIKPDRLLVSMSRTLNRDVRAAGKLRAVDVGNHQTLRSEEHTSELQSRFGISYAV